MMELLIVGFCQGLYIPPIHKLELHLPYVQILEIHNCGNTHRESFKLCSFLQDVLWRHGYVEHVVAIFSHQIQYE